MGSSQCDKPYSAALLNISAMSFGSLSANAIMALNKGAAAGNFYHDTGEGGISRYIANSLLVSAATVALCLSIGALAEMMQMSKSGVFAHFGSREELQISVIREYHHRFEEGKEYAIHVRRKDGPGGEEEDFLDENRRGSLFLIA